MGDPLCTDAARSLPPYVFLRCVWRAFPPVVNPWLLFAAGNVDVIRGVAVTDIGHRKYDAAAAAYSADAPSTASSCAAVILDGGDEVYGRLVVGSSGM